MDKGFSDEFGFHVIEFYFLAGHIFSLRKFEYVFLSIDHLHSIAAEGQSAHVSSFQPSIARDRLFGKLPLLVVSQNNAIASQPDLPPRRRVSILVPIVAGIAPLRDDSEFELVVWLYLALSTQTCPNLPY